MIENPFARNLRGYPRKTEGKYILDNNCIQADDTNNVFFNKISLDKRMDDYEYEKKYIQFVKEMNLKIGNFVNFEPELRKKRKVRKENKYLSKIGFNYIAPKKITTKTSFTFNSFQSTTENNANNNNNFLSMQNEMSPNNQAISYLYNKANVGNKNIFNFFDNAEYLKNKNSKNQMNLYPNLNSYDKKYNDNHAECNYLKSDGKFNTKDGENDKTGKLLKTNEYGSFTYKKQNQREKELKTICDLKSFRESVSKLKLTLNNDNIPNNHFKSANGISARKFLNDKLIKRMGFVSHSNQKKYNSDIFITNKINNLQFNNTDAFSKIKNNFRTKVEEDKKTQNFSSSQNYFFHSTRNNNLKENENNQIRKRPESYRTEYPKGIKNDHFNYKDKKRNFFSKKENLKIFIDKDNHNTNLLLSNKNSTQTSTNNYRNFSVKNSTTNHFNFFNQNPIFSKSNFKESINSKTKENIEYSNTESKSNSNMIPLNNSNLLDNNNLNKAGIKKYNQSLQGREGSGYNYNRFVELKKLRKNDKIDLNINNKSINSSIFATPKPRRHFSAREAYNKLSDRKGQFQKELMTISFHNSSIRKDADSKWQDPKKKVKRKFLLREFNDTQKEDKDGIVFAKDDKRDKDCIRSPDDETSYKKIYFVEKNKANMINHINTISKMTDLNYIKYGNFLEKKYDYYAHQVDIPEYIFKKARYRPKTNTREIDSRTSSIKIVFENILKVKSRILNVKLKKDGNPINKK